MCYFCILYRNGGALNKQAEIIPFELDPGNAGGGNSVEYLLSIPS